MAQTCGCDLHAGGGILDFSIRGPLTPSISPRFYGWIDQGVSSMVSEPEVFVSISSVYAFSSATHNNSHLPYCSLSMHMT
jgi:hypothetical protein